VVQLNQPFPEPMLRATTVELFAGLDASGLHGRGRLADRPDPARHDSIHAHCDLLVVGAGPAGLMAASTAARAGVRVVLVDDQPEAGGSLLSTTERLAGRPAPVWVAATVAELRGRPDVTVLTRTTALGYYDDGFVLALERRRDHHDVDRAPAPGAADRARQRMWRVRARHVVVATGAHERPLVFVDNDRPGIMLTSAARTYLNRYGVLPGRRIVVFTANDSAYPAALELAAAGAQVHVVEARPAPGAGWADAVARTAITLSTASVVTGTTGAARVQAVHVADFAGGTVGAGHDVECDLLLSSGGWNPAVHLFSQAGGRLAYDRRRGAFLPAEPVAGLAVAGSAAGAETLSDCLAQGAAAALAPVGPAGGGSKLPSTEPDPVGAAPMVLWRVPTDIDPSREFVDLQRDATTADILRATGAGLRSVEHVKRYTTIGTAHDQGKTSGVLASGIVAEALGVDIAALGTTSFRPPYIPVSFAALAGRDRGEIFDPVRTTAIHAWHVEHGALFENVGQWKRPRYYPQMGEELADAVARECAAARTGVAMMDASTLGKISVQGPDAPEFLDRVYTNLMSSLAVGRARYGVMCGMDGMVIDDGTVIRISEREFVLTTTTGNAAMVLDWLEELLQTEWPGLRVACTSITEQWATIALVGPQSRAVLGQLTQELDLSAEAFGFMSLRDVPVAGVPARVCRISFSGELAYEINVSAWYGRPVWEAVHRAGQPWGITAYGTETMHVLRAEKGYPIIGQDTDGTVTPQDLGLGWAVSRTKPDFIGKRSFGRPENLRPDRKQLVSLLPLDRSRRLVEGAQLIEPGSGAERPVPMVGHITSSYHSVALDRSFALALVRGGRARIGERLLAWNDGDEIEVEVGDAVLYDKQGARRDG
jgi:sarcosine oxidase subunit alpha